MRIFKKIILVTEKYGQLGNRLVRFARLFSLAEQEGALLIDLSLFQYSYLFTPKDLGTALLFRALRFLNNKRLKKLECYLSSSKYVKCSHINDYTDRSCSISSLVLKKDIQESSQRIILLTKNSFFVKGSPAIQKMSLSHIFTLKKKYLCKAKKLLSLLSITDRNLIVAVHIRQGEYKEFNNGSYYFEEEVYAESMRSLLSSYTNHNRPLQFILITKENIRLDPFEGLPFHFFGSQSIGVDQALLQQSDYIISTWSTFSMWPSFLHDIPQGIISNKSIPLTWNDFNIAHCTFY